MNDLEMAAKFREAAAYLRQHGLLDAAGNHGGPRCAAGALVSAMGCSQLAAMPLIYRCNERIEPDYDPHQAIQQGRMRYPIAEWSDSQTDREIVAQFFDGFAHDLELRHQIAATSSLPAESRHDAIIPSLEAANV